MRDNVRIQAFRDKSNQSDESEELKSTPPWRRTGRSGKPIDRRGRGGQDREFLGSRTVSMKGIRDFVAKHLVERDVYECLHVDLAARIEMLLP